MLSLKQPPILPLLCHKSATTSQIDFECLDPICACGTGKEDNEHFLLHIALSLNCSVEISLVSSGTFLTLILRALIVILFANYSYSAAQT